MKEMDTICRSVKHLQQKNIHSGLKTPAYAFAVSSLTMSQAGVTPRYSTLSPETSTTAPYCLRRSRHLLNRGMKQSTQNALYAVDLQEPCPVAKLCSWTSTAGVTHTLLSTFMLLLMSRATVPSSLVN